MEGSVTKFAESGFTESGLMSMAISMSGSMVWSFELADCVGSRVLEDEGS